MKSYSDTITELGTLSAQKYIRSLDRGDKDPKGFTLFEVAYTINVIFGEQGPGFQNILTDLIEQETKIKIKYRGVEI